jgi:hypothetical protein
MQGTKTLSSKRGNQTANVQKGEHCVAGSGAWTRQELPPLSPKKTLDPGPTDPPS